MAANKKPTELILKSRNIFRCSCFILSLAFFAAFVFGGYLRMDGADIIPSQLDLERDLKWMVFITIGMTFIYVFVENLVDTLGILLMFLIWFATLILTLAWASAYSSYVIVGSLYIGSVFLVFGVFNGSIDQGDSSAKAILGSLTLAGVAAICIWAFTDLNDDNVYLPLLFAVPFSILWVFSNHFFAVKVQKVSDEAEYTKCVDAIMLPFTSTTDFLKSLLPGPKSDVETIVEYTEYKREMKSNRNRTKKNS